MPNISWISALLFPWANNALHLFTASARSLEGFLPAPLALWIGGFSSLVLKRSSSLLLSIINLWEISNSFFNPKISVCSFCISVGFSLFDLWSIMLLSLVSGRRRVSCSFCPVPFSRLFYSSDSLIYSLSARGISLGLRKRNCSSPFPSRSHMSYRLIFPFARVCVTITRPVFLFGRTLSSEKLTM